MTDFFVVVVVSYCSYFFILTGCQQDIPTAKGTNNKKERETS